MEQRRLEQAAAVERQRQDMDRLLRDIQDRQHRVSITVKKGNLEGMGAKSSTLQGRFELCIRIVAGPCSQFPYSCICERFIYSQDRFTYFASVK